MGLYDEGLLAYFYRKFIKELIIMKDKRPVYYAIEDQINDCYRFLGWCRKDAHNMNDDELFMAERELEKEFYWIKQSGYIQNIPQHIASGIIIEPEI